MERTKSDLFLVVSRDEYGDVVATLDEVIDEYGHHVPQQDIQNAAYRLSCAGYGAEGIERLLPTVVQYSVEFAVDAGRLAERTAKIITLYDVDEENADEVLERARTLAVQKSLTVDDVFDVLERLGPTLQAL